MIVWLTVAGVLGATRGADAQSLTLRIDNGLVTLDANNVTVDEILARWTGGPRSPASASSRRAMWDPDAPVTLRLSGVSERGHSRLFCAT